MNYHAKVAIASAIAAVLFYSQFFDKKKGSLPHIAKGLGAFIISGAVVMSNLHQFHGHAWDVPYLLHFVPGVGFFLGCSVLVASGFYAILLEGYVEPWKHHGRVARMTGWCLAISLFGAVLMPILRSIFSQ